MSDGSITAVGSEMDSYYGRLDPEGAGVEAGDPGLLLLRRARRRIVGAAPRRSLAGNERLARTSLLIGAAGDLISPPLLISDLGRPERFLNMFRVFKVTSPMSVGSWILLVSGGASSTAAALELVGRLPKVKAAAEVVAALFGPPLTTYTGTLLANTAIPVWHEGRRELPWLFGASASASAGAAAAVFIETSSAGPARRLAVLGAAAELGLMETMKQRCGFVGEVYDQEDRGQARARVEGLHRGRRDAAGDTRQAEPRGCRRGRRARARGWHGSAVVGLPRRLPVGEGSALHRHPAARAKARTGSRRRVLGAGSFVSRRPIGTNGAGRRGRIDVVVAAGRQAALLRGTSTWLGTGGG